MLTFQGCVWERKPLFRKTILGNISTQLTDMLVKHTINSEQQALDLWADLNFKGGNLTALSTFRELIARKDFVWLILQDGTLKLLHTRPYLTHSYQRAYALCEAARVWQLDSRVSALARLGGLHSSNLHHTLRKLAGAGLLTRDASGHYRATPTDPPMPRLRINVGYLVSLGLYTKPTPDALHGTPTRKAKRRDMPRQKTGTKKGKEPNMRDENPVRAALAKRLVAAYVRANPQADTNGLDGRLRFSPKETGTVLGACTLPFALHQTHEEHEPPVSNLGHVYGLHRDVYSFQPGTQMSQAIEAGYVRRIKPDRFDVDSCKRPYVVVLTKGKNAPLREWWTLAQLQRITKVSANLVVSNFLSWCMSDSATIDSIFCDAER